MRSPTVDGKSVVIREDEFEGDAVDQHHPARPREKQGVTDERGSRGDRHFVLRRVLTRTTPDEVWCGVETLGSERVEAPADGVVDGLAEVILQGLLRRRRRGEEGKEEEVVAPARQGRRYNSFAG